MLILTCKKTLDLKNVEEKNELHIVDNRWISDRNRIPNKQAFWGFPILIGNPPDDFVEKVLSPNISDF